MKDKAIALIILCLIFTACAPSKQMVEKALVETIVARESNKTATVMNVPTLTPFPTRTITPTKTFTLISTKSPMIHLSPKELLCKIEDLPEGGDYVNPHGWSSWETNYVGEIDQYVDFGLDYAYETRRLSESWVRYFRRSSSAKLPQEIFCGIYLYGTPENAQIALDFYNWVETYITDSEEIYKYLDNDINIGDKDITYAVYWNISKEYHNTLFVLEYTYKNVLVRVSGYSPNVETFVKMDHLEEIGRSILKKMQQ